MTPKRLAIIFSSSILPLLFANSVFGQTYEVPPTSSSRSYVPYISDRAMEQCIVLYNKAKWLSNELKNTQVDQYSRASVDAYNNNVTLHARMTSNFNSDCAGKQSESAYKAAQELNKRSQRNSTYK